MSLIGGTEIVWTLCSLAVHDHLVVERGWSDERCEISLATVIARELVTSRVQ